MFAKQDLELLHRNIVIAKLDSINYTSNSKSEKYTSLQILKLHEKSQIFPVAIRTS